MHQKRLYVDKQYVTIPEEGLHLSLPGSGQRRSQVNIKTYAKRARFTNQPTPIKDFINFKTMGGNEIILNLENHENLATSELISGMLELGRHDKQYKYNWNNHPITATALQDLKTRIGHMNSKNLLQTALVLDRLQIIDAQAWNLTQTNILRLLHKYKGRDMALFFDLFDKEVLNDEGESYLYLEKAPFSFFERLTSLLPMHIAFMDNERLLRVLEVLVKKELGSERLFVHYIYMRLERTILSFSVSQYCRCVRSLADKGYSEDSTFWHDFMFKYVYFKQKPKNAERVLKPEEAKKIWETLIYLKLKCPDVELL